MKSVLVILLLVLISSAQTRAQGVIWAKQGVSTGAHEGFDLTSDPSGNIYVAGDLSTTTTFGSVVVDPNGLWGSMFITKYLPNGDVDWAKSIAGHSNNGMRSITYGNNAVYVCGYYRQTNSSSILDFGAFQVPGGVESNLFLAKISTDGVWQWVKTIQTSDDSGPNQQTSPEEMLVLPNGDVVMAGYCETSSVTIGATVYQTNPDGSLFFVSYDQAGNLNWFNTGSGALDKIELARSQNGVYFGAYLYSAPLVYDGQTLPDQPNLQEEVTLGEISSSGSLLWWKEGGNFDGSVSFGGMDTDAAGSLHMSFRTGPVNGITLGGIQYATPNGTESIFKTDGTGNVLDQDYSFTGLVNLASGDLNVQELISDGAGNTYITGRLESPSFAQATFFGDTIGGDGIWESFIAAYDSVGQYRGVFPLSYDLGVQGYCYTTEMILDPSGDLVVTGYFRQDIEIGPYSLSAGSPAQMFVLKLDPTLAFTTTVGVADLMLSGLEVFPNPFSEDLNITVESGYIGGMIEIIDLSGRTLHRERVASKSTQANVPELNAGMYTLRVSNEGMSYTKRIIKQ